MKHIAVITALLLTLALTATASAATAIGPAPASLITAFAQGAPPQPPATGDAHQHGQAGSSCCARKAESTRAGAHCAMGAGTQTPKTAQARGAGQGCCCCGGAQDGHAHQK